MKKRKTGQGHERVLILGAHDRVIELADQLRAERIAAGENAQVVRRRKDGKIVRIVLENFSDDTNLVVHRGNPRRYSHDHETEQNPPRVWTMRKLTSKNPEDEAFLQRIYRSSVLDNLKRAA